jgi:hypothetical protein
MVQALAQWQHPVASSEALDVVHWRCALHRTAASALPPKFPAMEVHLFILAASFV